MVRARRAWLFALGVVFSLIGCQDLIGLTPGKPGPTGTGGDGGDGGSGLTGGGGTGMPGGSAGSAGSAGSGDGGSTAAGGTGGAMECPERCVSTVCAEAKCVDGACQFEPLLADTIVENTVHGDCFVEARCDAGSNLVLSAVSDLDRDDDDDCTWDACEHGMAGHLPKRDGTPCNSGTGVCKAGACAPGAFAKNGKQDGTETGVDCGGIAPASCKDGEDCKVDSDCESGFCASLVCKPRLAAAVTSVKLADPSQAGQLTLLTWQKVAPLTWEWASVTDADSLVHSHAGAAFDAAGEAVAILRSNGTVGGRAARFAAGAWGPIAPWSVTQSSSWVPVFARTDAGTYFFAQNTNYEHLFVDVDEMPLGFLSNVVDVDDKPAYGLFSGAATTREGHASFIYADGTDHLVETRRLATAKGLEWSPPRELLPGNYNDTSPAAASIAGGTLVVACRRQGNDHVMDWLLILPSGERLTGEDFGPKFPSPKVPPRRFSLASRTGDQGGAILTFRSPAPDNKLEVWIFEKAQDGSHVWKNLFEPPLVSPAILQDPAAARGVEGAQAEVLWVKAAPQGKEQLVHGRLVSELGENKLVTMATPVLDVSSAIGAVAITTP